MGACGLGFAVQNQNLALLDHYLNQRSVVHMNLNLMAPPPLMGKEKGVSNGKELILIKSRVKMQHKQMRDSLTTVSV
jgi:hypothetical protein